MRLTGGARSLGFFPCRGELEACGKAALKLAYCPREFSLLLTSAFSAGVNPR